MKVFCSAVIFVRLLPVRLSACISEALTVRIYMKFDTGGRGGFYENFTSSKFG